MASDWNLLMERLAGAELTSAGYGLACAIARQTLGYPSHHGRVGQRRLRDLAGGMDGRTYQRALEELQEKGFLHHEPGKSGPGNRGRFELILEAPETTAPARSVKTTAPARSIAKRETTAPESVEKTLQTRVIEAYQGAGGSLELEDYRGSLVRQATTLSKRGIEERRIVDAAKVLGRERAFPGYLPQKVEELEGLGGLCKWAGFDRMPLTVKQLSECDCRLCVEWHAFRLEEASAS